MLDVNFAIINSDKLPGGVPLDPVEVLIEKVPPNGLGNVVFDAMVQLKQRAEAAMANVIYAVRREEIPVGYGNALYNVRYTAQTCRMATEDLVRVHEE